MPQFLEQKMHFSLIDQYRGLPRQVYYLFIARVVAAMGSFIYAFITMLLSSRLGFSDQQIATYLLFLSASYVPASLIGGRLADHYNRKYVYICAMLLADASFIVCGFICDTIAVAWVLIIGQFCMNMGSPVTSAMMMDLTTPDNRRQCFSLVYLGVNLGVAFGPLIAGFLFADYTEWIFWGQALINASAMIIVAVLVQDNRPDAAALAAIAADESRRSEREAKGSLLHQLRLHPVVVVFAAIEAVYALSYSQLSYILPLHMEQVFGIDDGSRFYGVIWSLNGLFVFLLTPLMSLLCNHFSPTINLFMSGICYMFGFGLYAYAERLPMMYTLVLVWTAGEVISAVNTGVFLGNHSPASHRARFQSIYDIIHGIGRAFGPTIMGAYLIGRTFAAGWLLLGRLCAIASMGYLLLWYATEKRGMLQDKYDEDEAEETAADSGV
ncbi:MAG: MFS transporter [Firmicutes bacterium]|nr:MFS transporter [Bacillota bacterium]MBQ6842042.1 MFS transporter [Bacillota bacterium]